MIGVIGAANFGPARKPLCPLGPKPPWYRLMARWRWMSVWREAKSLGLEPSEKTIEEIFGTSLKRAEVMRAAMSAVLNDGLLNNARNAYDELLRYTEGGKS